MRIVFIGTGEIGVPAFRFLLTSPDCTVLAAVTQPDKPVGRRQEFFRNEFLAALEIIAHGDVRPEHLVERVSMSRHGKAGSNVLFADGHVATLRPSELRLEMLDDGIRQR